MEPDKYQQAWQSDTSQPSVNIYADLLQKEVQRSQSNFQSSIFRRDMVEVGIALILLPYWFYAGITYSLPWTWWISVPALIWVAGFFLIDRRCHPQTPSDPNESLLGSAERSWLQVEHQIWLLRNIFWWYLLPFTVAIAAFFLQCCWLKSNPWPEFLMEVSVLLLFLFVVYWLVYQANQRAVRVQLEPRRQELLTLMAELGDDSIAEQSAAMEGRNAGSTRKLRRWCAFGAFCLMLPVLISIPLGLFDTQRSEPVGEVPSDWTFDEAAKHGLEAFDRRDFDRAILAWNHAIGLDPNHSEVRRWRGDAWLNKRDNDQALSEYEEAIRLDPTNGMAFCSRGAAWVEKREFDKAIESFDQAVEFDPSIADMSFYQHYRKKAERNRSGRSTSDKSNK